MKMSKMACLGALFLMPFMGVAQDAGIDLWDTWRQGFEKYEAAENAFKKKNLTEAVQLYSESQVIFQRIKSASPGWNKEVVAYRISLCDRKIKEISSSGRQPRAAVENMQKNEISRLTREINTLKQQLRQTRIELIDAKSAADRNALSEKQVKKLMGENTALEKKVAAREATIASLKADLVKADKSDQYQKELLKAKTENEKIGQDVLRLKKELAAMKQRAQKFQDQRNNAESKMFRLEEKLKELDVRKKEIAVLTSENRKLADSLNDTARMLKDSDKKSVVLQKSNLALQEKISALESGKIVSSSEKKLREELASEKKTVASLSASAAKSAQESKSLRADVEKYRQENQKLVLQLVKSAESVAKLHTDYNALMRTSEEQKKQIATVGVLSAENAKLKKDIDAIAKKYEELRLTSQKENSEKVNQLNAALEKARSETRQAQERVQRAEANLKGSSSKLRQAIVKLEEEKAVLRQNVMLSKQEAATVKSSLEKLTLEYNALKKEFASLSQAKPVAVVPAQNASGKELDQKLAKLSADLERVKNENAKYRVQLSTFNKLEQENKELTAKQRKINAEIAKSGSDRIGDLEKIRNLSGKVSKLETDLAAARKQNLRKDEMITAVSKQLKESVTILKKQVISAENAEIKVRKDLALLKMEYADLEKKLNNTVSSDSLKLAKAQAERLAKDLAALRIAKSETDEALKNAEELVKTQKKRLAEYAKELQPGARTQITKLTAAVAELQEAKIQYETLLRQLKGKVNTLNEDNKELRLANTALQAQTAELKVKPLEYQKTIRELKQKNYNLQNLHKENSSKVAVLTEKDKANTLEISTLNKELLASRNLVERYRRELNTWGDAPQLDAKEELAKNKVALDSLIKETAELRQERDMLKTELTLSKDNVVKYKKLSRDIEANLRITESVLTRVKIALARRTSAKEVNRLVAQHYKIKGGEFGPVASVGEIRKEVARIEAETAKPKLSSAEEKAQNAKYESYMKAGLAAEKAKVYSDAIAKYYLAMDVKPDSADVYKSLARVYLFRRDFANARDYYRDAVQKYKLSRDPKFEEQLVILAQEVADMQENEKNYEPAKAGKAKKPDVSADSATKKN